MDINRAYLDICLIKKSNHFWRHDLKLDPFNDLIHCYDTIFLGWEERWTTRRFPVLLKIMKLASPRREQSLCKWTVSIDGGIYWLCNANSSIAVRPQSVEILRKETYLTEGKKVHIVCEVNNSLRNENYLIAKQRRKLFNGKEAKLFWRKIFYRPVVASPRLKSDGISENLRWIISKSR